MNMYIKMKSVKYAGKHFHKGIYHVLMSQASPKERYPHRGVDRE